MYLPVSIFHSFLFLSGTWSSFSSGGFCLSGGADWRRCWESIFRGTSTAVPLFAASALSLFCLQQSPSHFQLSWLNNQNKALPCLWKRLVLCYRCCRHIPLKPCTTLSRGRAPLPATVFSTEKLLSGKRKDGAEGSPERLAAPNLWRENKVQEYFLFSFFGGGHFSFCRRGPVLLPTPFTYGSVLQGCLAL